VLFDDPAKDVNCFFNIGSIQFLELLDEDIEHGDGDFSLLSIVGVDVLEVSLLFLHLVIVYEVDLRFNYVLHQYE
jgi:hypothetical protein